MPDADACVGCAAQLLVLLLEHLQSVQGRPLLWQVLQSPAAALLLSA
jgi:hypothetical protein